jgi:hypothetical protein
VNISGFKAALAARLVPLAAFNGRIFVDRERDFADAELPCVVISFTGADAARTLVNGIEWTTRLDVVLIVKAAESARPDTTAEGYLNDVLARLYTDMKLGGVLADEMNFTAVRSEESANGERVVRRLVLELSGVVVDDLYAAVADDFITAAVEIDMASPRNDPQTPAEPDGQIDARTTITLPQ